MFKAIAGPRRSVRPTLPSFSEFLEQQKNIEIIVTFVGPDSRLANHLEESSGPLEARGFGDRGAFDADGKSNRLVSGVG